jgi:RHS repeat-associated protein
LLNLSYSYGTTNNNGNLQSQTIKRYLQGATQQWSQSYGYTDGVNRLTSAGESGSWSENFGYDTYGNRWVTNPVGLPGLTNETPQSSGWYLAKNQISGWGYDGAGNITSISGIPRSYSYDAENRLTKAITDTSNPATTTSTYSYDGDGRRVQKTTPSGTTTFVYDATGQLAAEYSTVANTVSGPEYLTADHLGSTRLVTDASGNPKKCYDYLPFGEEIPSGYGGRTASCFGAASYPSAPDVVSEKFTGKERDAETGLDFFEARYFSSAQGRFTSPDKPLIGQDRNNPQSWNLYSYVSNNPLRLIDPTGHFEDDCAVKLKDCGPQLMPLPLSNRRSQTQDRAVGALKGLGQDALAILELMGAPDANIEQIRDALHLDPSSQNEKFGTDVFGILAVLIPGGNTKEIKVAASSFEEARNLALKALGEINPATREASVGRVGELRNEVTGFTTKIENAFKQFRIDWDPDKGAHINVTVGKSKFAFTFPATLAEVKTLLKGNVQK